MKHKKKSNNIHAIQLHKLVYLSYNFLYKNQLDSFTTFPGLYVEKFPSPVNSFQLLHCI